MTLTVVICTHNRCELLKATIASLNAAERPSQTEVEILVIANNCSDNTHEWLQTYNHSDRDLLPIRWLNEATPGKSHALNLAIENTHADLIAFVDDDHRVSADYIISIINTSKQNPEIRIFCGRIKPDWTGNEPAWVHDQGPYKIYPLPVPNFDLGDKPLYIKDFTEHPIPGGGNLCVHREIFDIVGTFSTYLGPSGHNLAGGEDSDFVLRAIKAGETVLYSPTIMQFHYVDAERLKIRYLLQKAYQRSLSIRQAHGVSENRGRVPRYYYRKLANYLFHAFTSLRMQKIRFYFIRIAATLGEIRSYNTR